MILNSIDQSRRYLHLHPSLAAAFEWLGTHACSSAPGKHQVAEGVEAIVDTYLSGAATDKKWETHRRNIDLQVVLLGSELAGWAPVAELASRIPYDSVKDAEFYEPSALPSPRLILRPGLFAIFFPEDAHQPGVMEERAGAVRKVVFKLRA